MEGFSLLLLLDTLLVLSATTTTPAGHSLHQSLHHFEVLNKNHLQHLKIGKEQRSLTFSTLNRTFQLHLSPRRGLFQPGLQVSVVGADGRKTERVLDTTQFFTGEVSGEHGSMVSAHLDPRQGILTASISTQTEHYFIEPSHRHFLQSHDFHMISYRKSDLKYNLPSNFHCATNHSSSTPPSSSTKFTSPAMPIKSARQRRGAAPSKEDSCPMLLVASTSFHHAYSKDLNVESTIFFMVLVIDDIDQKIFRPTQWDTDILNFGLSIKNVTVFEAEAGSPAYNQQKAGGWTSSQMLRVFSYNDWSSFCLAHLFTFQDFTDQRLGVAYPASPLNLPGGICSPALTNYNGGSIATPNVGLSSFHSRSGGVLLLGEARLITAHELGHNWGSEHDPTNRLGLCNPSLSKTKGKFLMFPSMIDGKQTNNDRFSNCSKAMVSKVLRAKSLSCFENGRCGNYQVEEGEECDAGFQGLLDSDPCCMPDCKLRAGKSCSDTNHECCTDCFISATTKLCRSFREGNGQCLANVTCDGVRRVCPGPAYLKHNATCRELGKCLPSGSTCNDNGECVFAESPTLECYDTCRLHNLISCFCSGSDECNVCCQGQPSPDNATPCLPYFPYVVPLPHGTSCVGGLCEDGKCRLLTQDLVNRLYDLFHDISINSFIEFLSENIVGTVLTVTTMFWLVLGTILHRYDVQQLKNLRKAADYFDINKKGNDHEDLQDHALVEHLLLSPEEAAMVKKGQTHTGPGLRQVSFPDSLGDYKLGHEYSIEHGYQPRALSDRHLAYGKMSSGNRRELRGGAYHPCTASEDTCSEDSQDQKCLL